MPETYNPRKNMFFHILFIVTCLGIFLFLWFAPQETTPKLPHDENHAAFFGIDKKEAEKHCEKCHNPEGEKPLPEKHPPKYRCLFCHKRPIQ